VEKSFKSLRAQFTKKVSVYSDKGDEQENNQDQEKLFLTENPLEEF